MFKKIPALLLMIIILTLFAFTNVNAANQSCPEGKICLTNPLGNTKNIPTLIGYAIQAVMGIVGSLALVMIIYGGFVWMTASGNMEKVTQGKNILIWAIIGLVVIFSAYLLVSNIINISTGKGLLEPATQ